MNDIQTSKSNMESIKETIEIQKKKCERIQQTIKLVQELPSDVKTKIYQEYVIGIEKCKEFMDILKSDKATKLEYQEITKKWLKIKEYNNAIYYLCNSDGIVKEASFKYHYEDHYNKGKKSFVRLNNDESFVLCLLMTLYH